MDGGPSVDTLAGAVVAVLPQIFYNQFVIIYHFIHILAIYTKSLAIRSSVGRQTVLAASVSDIRIPKLKRKDQLTGCK